MSVLKVPPYIIISIKARPIRLVVIRETMSTSTFLPLFYIHWLVKSFISLIICFKMNEKILVFVLKTILQFVPRQYLDVYNSTNVVSQHVHIIIIIITIADSPIMYGYKSILCPNSDKLVKKSVTHQRCESRVATM